MKKQLNVPKFKSKEEEFEFWSSLDLSEYLEPSDLQPSSFPNLKLSAERVTMRVPAHLLNRLKSKANELDVPYQSLIKQAIDHWLKSA